MTCMEYRRWRLSGRPDQREPVGRHAETCTGCAEFDRAVARMDAGIEAVAKIQVPAELADRILLDRCLRARRTFLRLAMAASVVVLVGGGLLGAGRLVSGRGSLAASVLDYVEEHRPDEAVKTGTVTFERVVAAFAQVGGRVQGPIGDVLLCETCEIDGRTAQYLVVKTQKGTVVVLLLPMHIPERRERAERAGRIATVVPAGQGSLGIVARDTVALYHMEDVIRRQVSWS